MNELTAGIRMKDSATDGEDNGENYVRNKKWGSREARRRLLDEIAERFGVREPEDWKRVTTRDVASVRGSAGMLKHYKGSLFKALVDLYPESHWDVTKCRPKTPSDHWKNVENRRRFMDNIAAEFGVRKAEDWQRVSRRAVQEAGGYRLLALYENSLYRLLLDLYPEQDINALNCREKAPNGHWDSDDHCRDALEELTTKKALRAPWELSRNDVIKNGLGSLLKRFKGSYRDALWHLYPGKRERLERLKIRRRVKPSFVVEKGYWDSLEERKKFLDRVAERHGVREPSDWRGVTTTHITEMGGSGLLKRYNNSLYKALTDVYGGGGDGDGQEGAWSVLLCRRSVPSSFWEEEANIKTFLNMIKRELALHNDEDWFRVSKDQIRELNGAGLLRRMPLIDALRLVWPKKQWNDPGIQAAAKRSTQRQLYVALTGLFPATGAADSLAHRSGELI